MTLSLGALIGHYTVLEHVGAEGTTAEVYRGRDERNDRVVALKLLAGTSELSKREARAVLMLRHPNIVMTLDVVEYNGRPCLVQEWIDGGSLAADLDRVGRLSGQDTVLLGRDVASALAYAHQHNILHRDITPSNVLRTVGGTYKLTDFGAFGQLQERTRLTSAGQIAGTPLYMSPEQITGVSQSAASDIFGLGLLLYRCLHGHLPDEAAASYLQLAATRLRNPISVPPSLLQGLLERCLALDPARRPQSAMEVLTALDQIPLILPLPPARAEAAAPRYRGIPSQPSSPGAAPPSPEAAFPPPDVPLQPGASWKIEDYQSDALPRRRQPVLRGQAPAILLALAGVALVAGIGLLGLDSALVRIGAGLVITGVALVGAQRIRRRWASRAPEAERKAATILFGAGQRAELTQSLMIEVDQMVRNLNSLDAKILGMTVVAMINEYEAAKESSERQTALLNVVLLMEKLQVRFSPWHIRHKDAIATGVAVVGALAGVAGVVSGFLG
ncbi:MAG: protein kinase domain-containing protein [Pseudonocardiaceae bacterium]